MMVGIKVPRPRKMKMTHLRLEKPFPQFQFKELQKTLLKNLKTVKDFLYLHREFKQLKNCQLRYKTSEEIS